MNSICDLLLFDEQNLNFEELPCVSSVADAWCQTKDEQEEQYRSQIDQILTLNQLIREKDQIIEKYHREGEEMFEAIEKLEKQSVNFSQRHSADKEVMSRLEDQLKLEEKKRLAAEEQLQEASYTMHHAGEESESFKRQYHSLEQELSRQGKRKIAICMLIYKQYNNKKTCCPIIDKNGYSLYIYNRAQEILFLIILIKMSAGLATLNLYLHFYRTNSDFLKDQSWDQLKEIKQATENVINSGEHDSKQINIFRMFLRQIEIAQQMLLHKAVRHLFEPSKKQKQVSISDTREYCCELIQRQIKAYQQDGLHLKKTRREDLQYLKQLTERQISLLENQNDIKKHQYETFLQNIKQTESFFDNYQKPQHILKASSTFYWKLFFSMPLSGFQKSKKKSNFFNRDEQSMSLLKNREKIE